MAVDRFNNADHANAAAALKDGKVLVLFLASGSVILSEIATFSPVRITGTEPDGSTTVLLQDSLEGWSISDNVEFGLSPNLQEAISGEPAITTEEDAALSAYADQWQAAFLELRAACDKSQDADVAAAVANLEAIEVLSGPGQ